MPLPDTVSAKELARLLGVSEQWVHRRVAEGLLVRRSRGVYPLAENVQSYTTHLRDVASGRGGEDDVATLTAERARLAREQADGHALKNATARRELIPAEEVEAKWTDLAHRVRGGILAVPSRVRSHCPGLAHDHVEAIDRELRDALKVLADG